MLFTTQLVYKHIEIAILFMSRKNNSGHNHLITEIIHIAKFKTNPKLRSATHKGFETIPFKTLNPACKLVPLYIPIYWAFVAVND